MKKKKIIILCDFDGTIIENDGCDLLMESYAKKNWEEAGEKYLRKEISHAEMNESFAKDLKASKSEFIKLLKEKARIRDGFENFIQTISDSRLNIIVISAGWDIYITNVLSKIKFSYIDSWKSLISHLNSNTPNTPLITNKIINSTSENNWKIHTPWNRHSCQLSTPCKGAAVDILHQEGYEVVVIGNSETDLCMAKKAEWVFATDSLKDHLEKESIKYHSFSDFYQITKLLKKFIIKK